MPPPFPEPADAAGVGGILRALAWMRDGDALTGPRRSGDAEEQWEHDLAGLQLQGPLAAAGMAIRPVGERQGASDDVPGQVRLVVIDPATFTAFLRGGAGSLGGSQSGEPLSGERTAELARELSQLAAGWMHELAAAVGSGAPDDVAAVLPMCASALGDLLQRARPTDVVGYRLSALGVAATFGHLEAFLAADATGLCDRPGLGGPSRPSVLFEPAGLRACWEDVFAAIESVRGGGSAKAYAGVLLAAAAAHLDFCRARVGDLDRLARPGSPLAAVQPGLHAVLEQVACELTRLADEVTAAGWRPDTGSADAA